MGKATQYVILGGLLLALGCAQQESQMQKNDQKKMIDSYFLSLDNWLDVSPIKDDERKEDESKRSYKIEESLDDNGQATKSSCTVKQYDLTRTPEKIITQNPAAGILYPGALIQGRGYTQGPGGLRELSIRKRAPMMLVSDLATEKNAIMMKNVDYAQFEKARSELLNSTNSELKITPANFYYDQIEATQSNQAALDLGFSVKYIGNSLKGDLKAKKSSKEKVYMVVFEHRAFTLSVVAPSTPAGYFSEDLTVDDLVQQEKMGTLGADNPALYVSSVSYGRMLMFTITTKASSSDIQAALKGTYTNGITKVDAKLNAKYQQIMNESRVNVISLGGATSAAEKLIKTGKINEYFEQNSSLQSYVPISYVIRSVKDNSIAKVSETTSYTTEECTPIAPVAWKVRITLEKMIAYKTGASKKGEIYGKIILGGNSVMNRVQRNYITMRNGEEYLFPLDKNSIEVELPVNKVTPVYLLGYIKDNDQGFIWNEDDSLAEFNEKIGYTIDGRVLSPGTYSVRNHNQGDIEIVYKIEREPIYP